MKPADDLMEFLRDGGEIHYAAGRSEIFLVKRGEMPSFKVHLQEFLDLRNDGVIEAYDAMSDHLVLPGQVLLYRLRR